MSSIQWAYDLVERPLCEQLKAMGWQWIESDTDVPELTERANFREGVAHGAACHRDPCGRFPGSAALQKKKS
jgi:hypothetical protein